VGPLEGDIATPRGDDTEGLGVSALLNLCGHFCKKMTSGFPAEIRSVPAVEACFHN